MVTALLNSSGWRSHFVKMFRDAKAFYVCQKETMERSFADAKQNHGLRWTQYRGQKKNQNYNWLLCATQNLKDMYSEI